MALKLLPDRLFDESILATVFQAYVQSTGDFALCDRLDQVPIKPTYNAANLSIDIFPAAHLRRLAIPLIALFSDFEMGAVLFEFAQNSITHGHVFTLPARGGDLLPFYRQALHVLPPGPAAQLLFWKRAAILATETMLPGRRRIWEDLWTSDLQYNYTFHPALFASILAYKGPIPLFLQTVHAWLLIEFGGRAIHTIYIDFVCLPWILPMQNQFAGLWHQIMKQSAVAYLPSQENDHHSTIHVDSVQTIANADKLLCLLLLLFDRSYRARLADILASEPPPPILAALFSRYPLLQPQ